MPEQGTKVTKEDTRERELDSVKVTETTTHWNATSGISVDYHAHVGDEGIDLYADRGDLSSFGGPLDDDALRALMVDYGVLAAPR